MLEKYAHHIIFFSVFIVSGSFHEFAHAWSAWRLGDPTARSQGRMTLNPLAHIDPFGTLLLPIMLLYTTGMCFGWMRPAPVYPPNLRNRGRDSLLVSLAGPYSNLILAFFGAVAVWILATAGITVDWKIASMLKAVIVLNLLLAGFNLLPIPPLDGSSIVDYIRRDPNETYHRQGAIGFMIIILAHFLGLLKYLWVVVERAAIGLLSSAMIPAGLLAVFLVVAIVFTRKNRPEGAVAVEKIKEPKGLTDAIRRLDKAQRIAADLVEGKSVSETDRRWFERLREFRGDGEPLCAELSFDIRNEFCQKCCNLNRCLIRRAEETAAGEGGC